MTIPVTLILRGLDLIHEMVSFISLKQSDNTASSFFPKYMLQISINAKVRGSIFDL
jgi:hypothetical protein